LGVEVARMEVVACPACGQANSLPVGLDPSQARCASCGQGLQAEEPPRYYIAQGQDVQGPFERAALLQWIQQGKVRPEMMFCEEDTDTWVSGHDCPDLFPHLARPAPLVPVPRQPVAPQPAPVYEMDEGPAPVPRSLRHDVEHAHRAHRAPPAPGGVIFAAVLDFLNAAICLWFVIGVVQWMDLMDALTGGEYDKSPFIGLMLAGALFALGYIVLGFFLLKGSSGARIVQYVLSGLGIFAAVLRLSQIGEAGSAAKLTLGISIAVAVLVIVLISTPQASEFFARSGRRHPYRGPPRGGAYRRRPRRRRRY
jgi:hypothetical protein